MSEENKISIKEVEHIASLARIELTEDEKEKFSKQLSDVLEYIEQLQEIDTSKFEPVAQVTGLVNVMRKDAAKTCDEGTRKGIISSFPEEKDGYIKVRQVM